jgi:adenosylcobinamide-GDP ribazoletransferase
MNAFLAALQLLTTLPCGRPRVSPDAALWFPAVGVLIAAISIGFHQAFSFAGRPLEAALVLLLWTSLTGALHEDGLADTCDAFGGGRTRDDILRILKDSRIGAFGALALIFSILLRWTALGAIPEGRMTAALAASQIVPRAGMVVLARLAGAASGGMGGAFAQSVARRHAAVALVFALPMLPLLLGLSWYFKRRIGGVTGDCLGAANQLQEILILVLAACV